MKHLRFSFSVLVATTSKVGCSSRTTPLIASDGALLRATVLNVYFLAPSILLSGYQGLSPRVRALAHTPAFCRSRIRLRSCSFSHVPALPLPEVSLILNAAQERCLYIEIGSATCLCSYILGENTKNAKHNTGYIQF